MGCINAISINYVTSISRNYLQDLSIYRWPEVDFLESSAGRHFGQEFIEAIPLTVKRAVRLVGDPLPQGLSSLEMG